MTKAILKNDKLNYIYNTQTIELKLHMQTHKHNYITNYNDIPPNGAHSQRRFM